MAKAGAKKRVEDNRRRLQLLRQAITAANVLHLACRLLIFRGSVGTSHWLGLGLTSTIYLICYRGLAQAAEPTYSASGDIEDGGADLNLGGLTGYYHDLIYLSVFVQLASLLSSYFWLTYLLVPGYGSYLLWKHVLEPFIFTPHEDEVQETAAMAKRREKAERRQKRQRVR